MNDPTYDQAVINSNPEWRAAFIMSEHLNDNAPIGWSRYIPAAKAVLTNCLPQANMVDTFKKME